MTAYAVCADVGSTFTKAAVADLDAGRLVAAATHPTTAGTDVLTGLDAAVAAATAGLAVRDVPWYVCSSAGGGLRLAVVGYEQLVTAEAGHRVGLSAGARVVHVAAGRLDGAGVAGLRGARPDVVLLVGGTDGGDAEVLLHNAARLARARWRRPVVVAGNADAREDVLATLTGRGVPAIATDNVLPRIGQLAPAPERAVDRRLAGLAAVRRHARDEAVSARGGAGYAPRPGTPGRDLRDVRLLVGSGGVLRHAPAGTGAAVLGAVLADEGGGGALPRRAAMVVDSAYVLAAAGLLAGDHPGTAITLLRHHLRVE